MRWQEAKISIAHPNGSATLVFGGNPATRPDRESPVRQCYRYLSNRPNQLNYQNVIAKERPIGFGEIERAQRYVFRQRVQRVGAWCTAQNVEHVFAHLTANFSYYSCIPIKTKAATMPFRRAYPNLPQADTLETLISNRVLKGADKAAIDAQIWAEFGETWAVMFTDLSGFSRGVEAFGVIHFLQIIHESYGLCLPCIDGHNGTLLKTEGDSLLVIFPTAVDALGAAIAMQAATVLYNKNTLPEEQVLLCVGLGFGPMLKIGNVDIYGAQVNAASKLGEDTAQSGEILCTGEFKTAVQSNTNVGFTSIGAVMNMKTDSWRISY